MATQLRALLLMRVALSKYRLQLPGFELPEAVRVYQREYDDRWAQMLEQTADVIEGKPIEAKVTAADSLKLLQRLLRECHRAESQEFPAVRVQSFVTLVCRIDRLTASLAQEIVREFPSVPT